MRESSRLMTQVSCRGCQNHTIAVLRMAALKSYCDPEANQTPWDLFLHFVQPKTSFSPGTRFYHTCVLSDLQLQLFSWYDLLWPPLHTGFNVETVEYKNLKFTIWDVGGKHKLRPLWKHYYLNTQGTLLPVLSLFLLQSSFVIHKWGSLVFCKWLNREL